MRKQVLRLFVILSCMIILPQASFATKCPIVHLEVTGTIVDLETKQPLKGVNFFAFLNDSRVSGSNGWTPEYDYPNILSSDEKGNFNVPVSVHTPGLDDEGHCGNVKDIKITKFELIAFREGYMTERFVIDDIKFEPGDLNQNLNEKYQGKIIIQDDLGLRKNARF